MNRNILEICRNNYAHAIELDRSSVPGQENRESERRWDKYRVTFSEVINAVKNEQDAIFWAQCKSKAFDSRKPIGALGKILRCDAIRYPGRLLKFFLPNISIIYLYEKILKHSFPHFSKEIDGFSDVNVSWKETLLKVKNGRILSNVLFWHAYHILTCATYVRDREIKSVCEIGGGYGNIARLWFSNTIVDIDTYLIIDIPESLFFAEVFLRSTLKDVDVVYINSIYDINNDNNKKVVYLCPVYLHELTSNLNFDIIANSESIPEMGDDWTRFWKDWLNNQNASYFYSHNFAIHRGAHMPIKEEFISPLVPPKWEAHFVQVNHPMVMLYYRNFTIATILFKNLKVDDSGNSNTNNNIEYILELRKREIITQDIFIYYVYGLYYSQNINEILNFVNMSIRDLHFYPKELYYFINILLRAEESGEIKLENKEMLAEIARNLRLPVDGKEPLYEAVPENRTAG